MWILVTVLKIQSGQYVEGMGWLIDNEKAVTPAWRAIQSSPICQCIVSAARHSSVISSAIFDHISALNLERTSASIAQVKRAHGLYASRCCLELTKTGLGNAALSSLSRCILIWCSNQQLTHCGKSKKTSFPFRADVSPISLLREPISRAVSKLTLHNSMSIPKKQHLFFPLVLDHFPGSHILTISQPPFSCSDINSASASNAVPNRLAKNARFGALDHVLHFLLRRRYYAASQGSCYRTFCPLLALG
jgi:hypothetical protein